ncbi:transposase, IS605 OrfB family, central region [Variovorax sp. HW608]|uniref:RNA-guided endonuclease InsQ/TnpB family protein n=1 Tax=Variovorax sp. HW608 TaxID=1034889 RepID=UPI00081FBDAA|nr:RNA-guided endonuclease TnpB family protein [Variovorax sp. HW608]SCK59957.1 transposase, IS605 OrfB family, central region [Variovorax sp. HW608]
MLIVYRYRVKSLTGLLSKQARAVNFVFNYCNDRQKDALRFGRRWLTGFDLNKLTTGSSKELGVHCGTVNAVCEQYAKSRSQKKRAFLRYRSHKKSLGWVPMKGRDVKETPCGLHFHGREFKVFKSRPLPAGAKIKDGTNFAQDARGNWFLNVCIEVPEGQVRAIRNGVGIDLGLKDFATLSNGEKIGNPRHLRRLEETLASAQRAGKKRLATNVHAKIVNSRRDFLHKLSTRMVREFDYIAVGDVSSARLARTTMAKSVLDASWSSLRQMLAYKAIAHGASYEEVNEAWSTQTCNACGVVAGPKGRAGLNERNWTCGCGAEQDRDVNAARNILLRGSGHGTPAEGIPIL